MAMADPEEVLRSNIGNRAGGAHPQSPFTVSVRGGSPEAPPAIGRGHGLSRERDLVSAARSLLSLRLSLPQGGVGVRNGNPRVAGERNSNFSAQELAEVKRKVAALSAPARREQQTRPLIGNRTQSCPSHGLRPVPRASPAKRPDTRPSPPLARRARLTTTQESRLVFVHIPGRVAARLHRCAGRK